jgi:IS605 OrfB family transposase
VGRSKGTMITVKVPINWEVMTERQKRRLSRITSRDTRVIKAYLGVIERHEKELLVGKRKKSIDASKIDELTLRTKERPSVPHDFKRKFPNISVNELQECRETAIAMWKVYLALGRKKPLKAKGYRSRKLPRHVFKQRFEFVYTPDKTIKHWMDLRDSLDSIREGRTIHDRLCIPLNPSSYHLGRLKSGEIKSLQIVKDHTRKWWVMFKVKLNPTPIDVFSREPAVIGIDFGIKKAACSVVLTRNGVKHVHYWIQKEKAQQIERYDTIVASLQSKKEELLKKGKSADKVTSKLRQVSSKRENISLDYDRKLVKGLCEHILQLTKEFNVYIAIGRLKGIRNRARKGNGMSRKYRGMINRWAFARITDSLKHKLSRFGFDSQKVFVISEAWTSIKCHKCGHKGIRPKQSYFLCHTCGYRDNADKNAAINIARRLITLISSLKDEKRGLGQWLLTYEKTIPKARRSMYSKRRSLLLSKMSASRGQSVVDCYDQTSLSDFESSTDQTMAKTMETPSAAIDTQKVSDSRGIVMQRPEARSRKRNQVPVTSGKARVHALGGVLVLAGDSSREKGGT